MEERGFAPRRDPPRDEPQQLRREPASTPAGARAYAANLGEAGRLEPFARHRDQPARLAHPDEAAQDVRAREERAGFGQRRQVEHPGGVGIAERPDNAWTSTRLNSSP